MGAGLQSEDNVIELTQEPSFGGTLSSKAERPQSRSDHNVTPRCRLSTFSFRSLDKSRRLHYGRIRQ